jgi:hypothetical protein
MGGYCETALSKGPVSHELKVGRGSCGMGSGREVASTRGNSVLWTYHSGTFTSDGPILAAYETNVNESGCVVLRFRNQV